MTIALESAVRDVVDRAVAARITPGGAVVVGDRGAPVLELGFGGLVYPEEGRVAPTPATPDTIYDIASLTKPIATASVLMQLVAQGRLALDRPAAALLPELTAPGTDRITLRHLVGHASGLPAHVPFYRRLRAGERAGASCPRDALVRMVAGTALEAEPGTRVTYSDLGFILLGIALERAGGDRLDALARRLVTGPIGMRATRYVDLEAGEPRPEGVAPTEVCPVRGLVEGEVHDDNAHAGGGVHGHAGLFAPARDVAAFAREIARTASGERGAALSPEVVAAFLRGRAGPDSTWRLGWDTPSGSPGTSSAGDLWPRDGVGHLGFTGTSMWVDPARRRYAVLLTNRVHPSRDGAGIRDLRRAVMDTISRGLGG